MKKIIDDVSAFCKCAEQPIKDSPGFPDKERVHLQTKLVVEEVCELLDALYGGDGGIREKFSSMTPSYNGDVKDLTEVSDACADIIYVVVGLSLALGIPLNEIWTEVHKSNMEKFHDGVLLKRADGKVIKPEGWKPPDIMGIIKSKMENCK